MLVKKQKEKLERQKVISEFWQTPEAMDAKLSDVDEKTGKAWVLANIKFRKIVWQKKFEPKCLFYVTRHKKPLTYEELKNNLLQLICADII